MRIRFAFGAALLAAFALLFGASSAQALTNGSTTLCSHYDGTLCLFYNSNLGGSRVGIYGQVPNYAVDAPGCSSQGCPAYEFLTSGSGEYKPVKNDAASVYNEASWVYWVYYNSSYSGPRDQWDPEGYGTFYGNLNATYNENASQLANADI
ncbi:peptidase inhibitor family I36 protein [Streptomyces sp. NPDC048304]|jgi:Peptidase inhibitor family I36|uniref:peptidase inhibitor family I36 protein n=1 Tax=Streptomyces sp. NPDC048304 TaxID=3154820 RepID=UPI0033CF4430